MEKKTNFVIRSYYFGGNTLQPRHVAERILSGGTKAGEAHMNAAANGDPITLQVLYMTEIADGSQTRSLAAIAILARLVFLKFHS